MAEEKGVNSAIEETLKAVKSLEDALKGQSKENIEKEISELNMKIKEFEEKKDAIQGNYDEINSIVSEFKTKINFLKKDKLSKLEKEIEEKVNIKNEIEQLKKQFGPDISKLINERKLLYEGFIGDIQELKTKIIDLDEVLQQLSSLEGRCPICESILTEERKKTLIEQKQKLINELKIRLEESIKNKELSEVEINNIELAVKKLGEMVVEIKNFDSLIEDFENSKKLFLELSEKLIEVENQLSQFKKELSGIEIRLKEATDKKQQFKILSSKLEDYSIRRDRFNELMKESKHFEVKISEMEQKISGRDFASMEYQLRELIKKEKEAETKIQSFDQLMEEKNSRIREYEKNLNEAIEHKKEIEKLDKIIKDLKIFEEALKHTQTELRTEFVEAVNYTMNKIWSALYPYQDFVGVNLAIEDGDYVLKLQERSRSYVNADGIASGGERSIACLALRIAFSLVLAPHMRMLILDEPTANLDSRAVAELATTLRERVCEFIDQTFLITHQAELEDAVTGNAYRIERDKENDGVTKIVAVS